MFLREVWRPEKLNSEADSRVEWAAMLVGQGLAPVQDMLFRILESGTRVFYNPQDNCTDNDLSFMSQVSGRS